MLQLPHGTTGLWKQGYKALMVATSDLATLEVRLYSTHGCHLRLATLEARLYSTHGCHLRLATLEARLYSTHGCHLRLATLGARLYSTHGCHLRPSHPVLTCVLLCKVHPSLLEGLCQGSCHTSVGGGVRLTNLVCLVWGLGEEWEGMSGRGSTCYGVSATTADSLPFSGPLWDRQLEPPP